ncbi:MAG TPA: hypothetical protein IAA00_01650 [Candidatus Blautia ornithocaccae]|nr:hypothetical protein [Candidatus Blautia ornithocaccae]
MITNTDITIFNQFADRNLKKIVYVPHYIKEAWFHSSAKTAVEQGGLSAASEYKLRIPFPQDGWLPSNDFRDLAEPGDNWTVQEDDFFIIGKWEEGSVEGIEEIRKKFLGVSGIILNHSENFFGSSPHIRIGGGD